MPVQKQDLVVLLSLATAVAVSALACAGERHRPGEPTAAGVARTPATAAPLASTKPPAPAGLPRTSAPAEPVAETRASAPAEPVAETARPPETQLVACDLGSPDVVKALATYERKRAAHERRIRADTGGAGLGLSGMGEARVSLTLEGASVSHEAACPDVVTWFRSRRYVLTACLDGHVVEAQAPRHVVERFRFSDTGDVTALEPELSACYRQRDPYFSAKELLSPWQHGAVDVSLTLVAEKQRKTDKGIGLEPLHPR